MPPENRQDTQKRQGGTPLRMAAEEWYRYTALRVKESTAVKYKNMLNGYLLPVWGERALEELDRRCIEEGCDFLLTGAGKDGTGLSERTVSDLMGMLKNIVRYAQTHGSAPLTDVFSVHVRTTGRRMRVFSHGEQQILVRFLADSSRPKDLGILLCLFTGLRVGEVCALRWEDLSLTEKTLHVSATMQRIQTEDGEERTKIIVTSPKSSTSDRYIPLPDLLIDVLSRYQREHDPKGYFLTGRADRFVEPRTMQNHLKRTLKQCGIADANFHALRHTFATRCVELGFDVKSLSEILGHATVNITMNRYVHPTMEHKRQNMQKLSALFSPINSPEKDC